MRRPSTALVPYAVLGAASLGLFSACGGTNGRENLPNGGNLTDPSADGGPALDSAQPFDGGFDAAPDATLDAAAATSEAGDDSGAFDATILYADAARLPDVFVVESGPVDSGPVVPPPWASWPVCQTDTQVPYDCPLTDDAAGCPTRVWWKNEKCDECIRAAIASDHASGSTYGTYPPCSDLHGAGPAMSPSAPDPKSSQFDLCAGLFTCVLDQCTDMTTCAKAVAIFCGTESTADCEGEAGPAGPCVKQVQAAYESVDPTFIVNHFETDPIPGQVGSEGKEIGYLLQLAFINCTTYCIVADAGPSQLDAAPNPTCNTSP
jgi:hypothetical protein